MSAKPIARGMVPAYYPATTMKKICVICGEDCSGRPRTKDPRGHYYCLPCYEQAKRKFDQKHAETADAKPDDQSVLTELFEGVVNNSPPAAAPPQITPVQVSPVSPKHAAGWTRFFLSPRVIVLCLLAVISVAVLAFGDLVTILFFLFVAFTAANGYWIGAARIGALFGGLLAGALFAVPMGKALEGLCAAVFSTTGATNRMISTGLSALACVVLVTITLQVVIGQWQKRNPQWKGYDRMVGSGLGLLEGALLGLLLIWAVLSLEPIAATSLAQTQSHEGSTNSNPISRYVVAIAQTARGSKVGRLADAVNPLNEMRLLTLLSKGLVVLNDPGAHQAFINHPAIETIRQRPSVQQAMKMLADDPEISLILENESIRGNLSVILASPTLLAIFDQTDIVADLSPLADEIELAINEAMEHRTR